MSNGFARELQKYGPNSPRRSVTLAEARAYCRQLALTHYENFAIGSLLLPRELLRHFHHIYAYCRWADDLADETADGSDALRLLQWWRDELHRCYDGTARHPVMIALSDTIQEFNIPKEPFLDLLIAFEQDQRVTDYQTFEQLLEYCRHSANPVGRLVLYLFRCHDEKRGRWADSICTGLQLANFWQDVARDLEKGRIYIPREDRERFGYADHELHQRRWNQAFFTLMQFEVERARRYLRDGLQLVPLMPARFQIEIAMFAQGGLGILDAIQSQDYDVWRTRPTLSKWRKASFLTRVISAKLLAISSRPVVRCRGGELSRSYRYCERVARRHARNFYYAFLVLPRPQQLAMCALYTFLRIADDIADEPGERAAQRTGLVAWREGLNDAVHGTYSHPCHAALHHTIQQFDIPPSLLHAVIDGVAMDLSPQRFNTFAELYQYCYRVASAVGLASIRIWDCADPVAEEFAEASGIAFQLTNILRDVAADAQAGRCYIPQEDLRRFDCTEAQLRDGPWNDRYQALVQFEADRAREYYANAEPLAALLPPPGRAVFQIMTRIYRGLLEELTRTTFRRDGGVVRLSAWRKIAFVLQALPIRFGWT